MARIPKTMPMRVTIIQGRVWPAPSFGLRASFGNDGNDDVNNGDGDAITEDKKHVDNRADDTDDFHHAQYDNDH